MVKPVHGGFGGKAYSRTPKNVVQGDLLRLNIEVGRKTIDSLRNLSREQYASLVGRLEKFQKVRSFFSLIIDPPKKLREIDFSSLSDAFLRSQIEGVTLDLTSLENKLARFNEDSGRILAEDGRTVAALPPDVRPPIESVDVDTALAARASAKIDVSIDINRTRMVQYHGGSEVYRFGPYSVEYTGGHNGIPSKVYDSPPIWNAVKADANEIAKDLYGEALPEDEAIEHFRHVDHSFTVRTNDGTPVAKAMSEVLTDFVDLRGRRRVHVYYTGILAKKGYRGGIFVNLTFNMMFQIFKSIGIFRLIFKRTPLTFRTSDKKILDFGRKYFGTKLHEPLTAEEQAQVEFVAQKKVWELDRSNVCRNAYNRMMAESEGSLIDGLNSTDARVFTGYITMWSVIKLAAALFKGSPKQRKVKKNA